MFGLTDSINAKLSKSIFELKKEKYKDCEFEIYDEYVVLKKVVECGRTSEIIVVKNETECLYRTDKPKAFWEKFIGKTVEIVGLFLLNPEEIDLIIEDVKDVTCFGNMLNKLTKEKIDEYERDMKQLSELQKTELFKMLDELDDDITTNVEERARYISIEEIKAKYNVLKPAIPINVQDEIENALSMYNEAKDTDKTTYHKVAQQLLEFPWTEKYNNIDMSIAMKKMDELYIGDVVAKDELMEIANQVNASNDKKTVSCILLVGETDYSTKNLAKCFASAIDRRFKAISLAGKKDSIIFKGTTQHYANGCSSSLYKDLCKVGKYGILTFENIDKLQNEESKEIIYDFITSRVLSDEFFNIPLDFPTLFIIATARSANDLPKAFLDNSYIINIVEPTDEDKKQIINREIIPALCDNYNLSYDDMYLDSAVCEMIISEIAFDTNIKRVENVVKRLFFAARHRKIPLSMINTQNLREFISIDQEKEKYMARYVTELSEMDNKFYACYDLYTDSIRKRIKELLELAHDGNDSDKEYAIKKSLPILVNTLNVNAPEMNIKELERALDESHYGLKKAKREILKVCMAHKLSGESHFTAILLVSPPGCGKTTLVKSIAKCLDRPYIKINMGGLPDEKQLVGNSRTIKDALPGVIANEVSKPGVGKLDPVILFDELDKLNTSKESPYGVLHNILDNVDGLRDNFLDVDIPSDKMIIFLSANDISKVPMSIRDRVKIINIEGYSILEKKYITKEYLLDRMKEKYHRNIKMSDDVIEELIFSYCTSMGVRDVVKALENVIENIALDMGDALGEDIVIGMDALDKYMGLKTVSLVKPMRDMEYGQANALAVSGLGEGSVLEIQIVDKLQGKEEWKVTGMVKESCMESVENAITVVNRLVDDKIPPFHLQFGAGEGSIEKNGSSAGACLVMCLLSFVLKKKLPNIAITGEISLNNSVRQIGGVKAKINACMKNGIEKVYIPRTNYKILEKEDELKHFNIDVIPVDSIFDIINDVFGADCLKKEGAK